MFDTILAEQNPHWMGRLYPETIERACFGEILRFLNVPHVVSITGVRRAGKSTLLKQTINYLLTHLNIAPENIVFLNLEHPYLNQYKNDVIYLEKIFENYVKIAKPQGRIYCFLDEIQFFDRWPIFIKSHYEQKNIKFFITGSNSFLMSQDLLTLLSGRTLPVEVFPLFFQEFVSAKTHTKIGYWFNFVQLAA